MSSQDARSRATSRASGQTRRGSAVLHIPEPLAGGNKVEDASLSTVPTSEALTKYLNDRGLDTSTWGQGDTKEVSKYWKEIKLDEAGLEIWQKVDGTKQIVRVVHVLRAKVGSPESSDRGIWLFNTWQQYGDGRTRTRNGLLSEKLSTAEMPLEDHLHEVCERAVTEEEMQRVTESLLKIGPGVNAPEFDSNYKCPLKVLRENFVDHTIELEESKSYPGLLTMYHLYTVDIICSGLPAVDFNTLEFNSPDKEGKVSLKYIHAWVWLEWAQIQRYLLEGSTMKERKQKDSFGNSDNLVEWLSQFDLDLDSWGNGTYNSVEKLFEELQNEETHLEIWGRQDGVPLLMRVAHVIQLKVGSTDPRQSRKFLFNTWSQTQRGQLKTVNRLMAKKVSTAHLPFDEDRFAAAAREAVSEELSYIVDVHFELNPSCMPSCEDMKPSGVSVSWAAFEDHRVAVEESPSYKGVHTMYHLYSMEVECEGLPLADFGSLEFRPGKNGKQELRYAHGWRWVSWEQTLDVLQVRSKALERRSDVVRQSWDKQTTNLKAGLTDLDRLKGLMGSLGSHVPKEDPLLAEAMRLQQELQVNLREMQEKAAASDKRHQQSDSVNLAKVLPPSMLSKMSEQQIVSKDFFQEAEQKRLMEAQATRAYREGQIRGKSMEWD